MSLAQPDPTPPAPPDPPSPDLVLVGSPVTKAVGEIHALPRPTRLEFLDAVGAVVLRLLYDGDEARFRDRGAKDDSLRSLSARLDPSLQLSPATLYRCVEVHLLLRRAPEVRDLAVTSTHLRAVFPLPADEQVELLRTAGVEHWPCRRLEEEVASRHGRRCRRREPEPAPPRVEGPPEEAGRPTTLEQLVEELERLVGKDRSALPKMAVEFRDRAPEDVPEYFGRLVRACHKLDLVHQELLPKMVMALHGHAPEPTRSR